MAVNFLSQVQPVYPGNADVSSGIAQLGNSIADSIKEGRNRNALIKVSQAMNAGDTKAASAAAFESGNPQLALQVNNLIESKANRAEDRAWRAQRAAVEDKKSDRSFALQEKQINASMANAAESRSLAREQFNFEKEYKEKEFALKRLAAEFKVQGGYKDMKEKAEVEGGLRKEFTKISDDFVKVRDAYGRIQASSSNPSAAGDLAMIFNYMKMLDPGSTVREGEFATAQNAAGIPDRIRAQWNKAISGERLAPAVRKDFTDRASMLYETQAAQHKKIEGQFTAIGERLGVDVRNVVPDLTAPQAGPAAVAPGSPPPPPSGFQLVQ